MGGRGRGTHTKCQCHGHGDWNKRHDVSRHTHIHARTQVKTVLLVLASYSSFYVAEHIVGTSGVSMPRDSGRAGWVGGGPSRLSSNHCFVVNCSLLS